MLPRKVQVPLRVCRRGFDSLVAATRDIVAAVTGRPVPQVLVRIGTVPALEDVPPPTPRRPLSEVLHSKVE
jgi:hypothetical protein